MLYNLQFTPYQRPFRQPLQTSQGVWSLREGVIIRLIDSQNRIFQGEIAPLPSFGSETWEQAISFCQSLGDSVTEEDIYRIPNSLPACQFAFESAILANKFSKNPQSKIHNPKSYSWLLPTGKSALDTIGQLPADATTFKWKIGIKDIFEEIELLYQLVAILPEGARLRLDANGGLNLAQARQWLEVADQLKMVEFVEQPLPVTNFQEMLLLTHDYKTKLALDESVANLKQLETCYRQGWQGIFVVKVAIAGYPSQLLKLCQDYSLDIVVSSVFETEIGRQAVLQIANKINNPHRALGMGVNHWFD